MPTATRELLAEYANLLNRFGVDSEEADDFFEQNKCDGEFVELAALSRTLKKALTTPTSDGTTRKNDCRA